MSKTILSLTAAILISLPCTTQAQVYPGAPLPVTPGTLPPHASPRQVFNWLDVNHDGYLTLNEFLAAPWIQNRAKAIKFFRWMDTNGDGFVSLPEYLAANQLYGSASGYTIRTVYPWGWAFWRPWQYGWYWHTGWHRSPGNWSGYAVRGNVNVNRANRVVNHSRNVVNRGSVNHGNFNHSKNAKHPKVVAKTKHTKPAKAKHSTGHKALTHKAATHKKVGHKSGGKSHGKGHK